MVAAYRDPAMRQWLRHLITTADEARGVIQARRADWAAGTGFSFAVLLAEPGVPGAWSAASPSEGWMMPPSRAKSATGSRRRRADGASPRGRSTP